MANLYVPNRKSLKTNYNKVQSAKKIDKINNKPISKDYESCAFLVLATAILMAVLIILLM